MAPRHLFPILIVLLIFAGCVGSREGPGAAPASGSEPPSGSGVAPPQPLAYPIPEPVTRTLWANDSFPVNQNCSMTGCAAGMGRKITPITDLLPSAAPVKLHVELDYGQSATSQLYGAPLYLILHQADSTLYNLTYQRPQTGVDIFDWTLLKGSEPITIEIMYTSPHPTGPDVAYTLLIEARADPLSTPGSVPVEIRLGAGDEFIIDSAPDSPPNLILFDSGGRMAGKFPATSNRSVVRVPHEAGTGPIIALLDAKVKDARILTNATDAPLRPLGLEYVLGPVHSTTDAAPVEWDFEVEGMPLLVGLYTRPSTPLWSEFELMDIEVQSPLGVVLEGRFGCQGCITNDATVQFRGSEMGHPNLAPGTYHARVDSTQAGTVGLEVGDFSVYFVR